jgi:proteasome beta subunit
MRLPLFSVDQDPGTSFERLLQATGTVAPLPLADAGNGLAHATTVVALRSVEGVVLCADRQASTNAIADRDVHKIAEADRHTALAISGVAAIGMQFIKFAQLSFEHYEKMRGTSLSLKGKANFLGPIVRRNNLSTGLMVLPLLAGYDLNHDQGRVYEYDGAGGCYEKDDYAVIGSGSSFALGALRLGYRDNMSESDALELAALAIYEAGDNDIYTGGPDFVRGIYPILVTVTAEGFRELSQDECGVYFRTIQDRRTETKGRAGGSLR